MIKVRFLRLLLGIFAIAASAIPAGALASPVYLSCTFTDGNKDINITVDEQTGTAAVTIPSNGNSFLMKASFSADKVLFNEGGVYYDLNRVDLTLVRTVRRFGFVYKGACSIVKAPKRAF